MKGAFPLALGASMALAVGSLVFAGTINRSGAFRFEAKKVGRGTVLRQATLRGADFTGADLTLASFREIDLTDVKMDGVDLTNAVVRDNRKDGAPSQPSKS